MNDTHVIGDYTAAISIDGSTNYFLIQPGDSSTAYRKINRNVFLGVSGQPVDISTSQSLSNKTMGNTNALTLKDTSFTLQDDSDTTKQAQFQLSGITTATTRTYTLPNASSTLADISTAQTLTNKSLTSPTISGGSIDNSTITVDSIAGHTTPNSGTVYGLSISSGKVGANGITTASVTDGAITPAKLQSGTGSSWAWQTWTPTLANLTLGNGTQLAYYVQTGKMVTAYWAFTLGSTSSVGSAPTVSLPVPASGTIYGLNTPAGHAAIGWGYATDAGINIYALSANIIQSTTTASLYAQNAAGTYVVNAQLSATIPFTFGTGDGMEFTLVYEAA